MIRNRLRIEKLERKLGPSPSGDWSPLLANERVPADIRQALRETGCPPDVAGFILALSRLSQDQRERLVEALES